MGLYHLLPLPKLKKSVQLTQALSWQYTGHSHELVGVMQKFKNNQFRLFPLVESKANISKRISLTLSWRRSLSHRNQSIDLLSKLIDWFLQERNLLHERVNQFNPFHYSGLFLYPLKRAEIPLCSDNPWGYRNLFF